MPDEKMPGATAQAAAVPGVPMPDEPTPDDAMPVTEKTPTKGDQGMMSIHAGPRRTARLDQTAMRGQ